MNEGGAGLNSRLVTPGLIVLGLLLMLTPIHASELDLLFILIRANPLSGFSLLDPFQAEDPNKGKSFFQDIYWKQESFNALEVSQTLLYRQHTIQVTAFHPSSSIIPFASLTIARGYEPQDPRDHLRLKQNNPITQSDSYGCTTGLQHHEAGRWWAFAMGVNQVQRRSYQNLRVIDTRQALTLQYAIFDRSFEPYIVSGFIGLDGGVGGLYARFTPYVRVQDGVLLGPDFHLYRDQNLRKGKVGGAIAGLQFKKFDVMFSSGYDYDSNGHQGAYFSLGLARIF